MWEMECNKHETMQTILQVVIRLKMEVVKMTSSHPAECMTLGAVAFGNKNA